MTLQKGLPMIMGMHHVAIRVTDIERSTKFYRDLLGFKVTRDTIMEGVQEYAKAMKLQKPPKIHVRYLQPKDGGSAIELFHFLSDEQPAVTPGILNVNYSNNYIGTTHICFNVVNLEETYNDLLSKGVKFNCPPQRCNVPGVGEFLFTYFEDYDGVLLEIREVLTKSKSISKS